MKIWGEFFFSDQLKVYFGFFPTTNVYYYSQGGKHWAEVDEAVGPGEWLLHTEALPEVLQRRHQVSALHGQALDQEAATHSPRLVS